MMKKRIEPKNPQLEYTGTITVDVGTPINIGQTANGERKVVPIRGGQMQGPQLNGTVYGAGADFQRYPVGDLALLEANYVIRLDDGTNLLVENNAVRTAEPESLKALMDGRTVDPDLIYFRCVPTLSVEDVSIHRWVNRSLFIGTGERYTDGVRIQVFRVL